MQTTGVTHCSCCGRPLVCSEELARWLDSVMRAGARVYCSLVCSAATEDLELTGDAVVEESRDQIPASL